MSNSKSTEELHKKIDLIFEDLAFGHNFEYGGKAIKELFDQELAKRVEETKKSTHKLYERELKHWKGLAEMLMCERDLKNDPKVIVVTEEQLATLNNQSKETE